MMPYLCGGILFSLILQARKTRTKTRDKLKGGSDGLKDTDVMMGLVEWLPVIVLILHKVQLSENALRNSKLARITGQPISRLPALRLSVPLIR